MLKIWHKSIMRYSLSDCDMQTANRDIFLTTTFSGKNDLIFVNLSIFAVENGATLLSQTVLNLNSLQIKCL